MNIQAFTTCVGKHYRDILAEALPAWLNQMDVCVITKPEDEAVIELCRTSGAVCVTTDVFTRYGACFNKGAALNVGYGKMRPDGLVVHFDSDIKPPLELTHSIKKKMREGCLGGARRVDVRGRVLDELPIYPYGYFHVWYADDPAVQLWPLFEIHHPHAGNYDANFADRWSPSRRIDLGFSVVHVGEPRSNWYGPEASPEAMNALRRRGLANVRAESNRGVGWLDLPRPSNRCLFNAPEELRDFAFANHADPFDNAAEVA